VVSLYLPARSDDFLINSLQASVATRTGASIKLRTLARVFCIPHLVGFPPTNRTRERTCAGSGLPYNETP
jgi:hypothetical protein